MVNDTVDNSPASAKLASAYLVGGLLTFGIAIFALLVSSDEYLNAITYKFSVAVFTASFGLFLVLVFRLKMLALDDEDFKVKSAHAPYLLVALYAPVIFYAILSLLVLLTSKDQVQISTHVYARGGSRYCKTNYEFYNEPISRQVSVCHDKLFWAAKSGDTAIVLENVGPLGARIQAIEHRP
jgi:hypothetical protein